MSLKPIKKSASGWSSVDHQMMSLALQLAQKGQYTARPNPMVGSVIIQGETIVGQGWHQKSGLAHAEINALKQAGEKAWGATCYVTLEPCAHTGKTGPCAQALINAGVGKVIAAMSDPNPQVAGKGFQMLLNEGIEVEYGLLESQALHLNRGFINRFTKKRPWVTCKLAMSLDGRTALADGASKWITGSASRADVQKLRARQDAVITGVGTVLADNPSLNVRKRDTNVDIDDWFETASNLGFVQPARILLDRSGRAENTAKLFNNDTKVFWFSDAFESVQEEGNIYRAPGYHSIAGLLQFISEQGLNNVLLESGHRLAGEFLKHGFIDELVVYIAPKLMGNNAMGLFELDVQDMQNTPQLKLNDLRQLGDDIRLTYEIE